jgi:hypothetical protein
MGLKKFGSPNFYFSEIRNINALGSAKRPKISRLQEAAPASAAEATRYGRPEKMKCPEKISLKEKFEPSGTATVPVAFRYDNEVRPHSSRGGKTPRELHPRPGNPGSRAADEARICQPARSSVGGKFKIALSPN